MRTFILSMLMEKGPAVNARMTIGIDDRAGGGCGRDRRRELTGTDESLCRVIISSIEIVRLPESDASAASVPEGVRERNRTVVVMFDATDGTGRQRRRPREAVREPV